MSGTLAKVFWSDDVFIDPNVIFGTTKVQSVWSTPPATDRESSPRRQSLVASKCRVIITYNYTKLPMSIHSQYRKSTDTWEILNYTKQ